MNHAADAYMRGVALPSVLALAIFCLPAAGGAASWLDASPPAQWNRAGAPVPSAPPPAGDLPTAARCRGTASRLPRGSEEQELASAGWTLFGNAQEAGGTLLVKACTSVDGMCRPLGYQVFVFVGGQFAGTLAPGPMFARSEGNEVRERLVSPDAVVAEFARYAPADPLCCPSRVTTVTYAVHRGSGPPVLVPTRSRTAATVPRPDKP
ncbi:MAG TPA: LppP/LprE family lipoprotein [Anaeromyxobacteraceae bacterium]|nr:LppP/LprE family lipoprotein [Anaeromyxobacteraceae bacterium]